MLAAIVARFNEGGISIVEAGTGTGKSLAYLVPAVRWAQENSERTVVSTNTINLQEAAGEQGPAPGTEPPGGRALGSRQRAG